MEIIIIIFGIIIFIFIIPESSSNHGNYPYGRRHPPMNIYSDYHENDYWEYRRDREEEDRKAGFYTVLFVFVLIAVFYYLAKYG